MSPGSVRRLMLPCAAVVGLSLFSVTELPALGDASPSPPGGAAPKAVAGSSSTNMFVVFGSVSWSNGLGLLGIADTVAVTNQRTRVCLLAPVGAVDPGSFSAVFMSLQNDAAAAGDTLAFRLLHSLLVGPGRVVIGRPDISSRQLRSDLSIASPATPGLQGTWGRLKASYR
jgi:hypothetical protein